MAAKISFSWNSFAEKASVLIIGPHIYFEKLCPVLKKSLESFLKMPIEMSSAESLTDLSKKTHYSSFDFIIGIVNISKDNFQHKLLEIFNGLSTEYLSNRFYLVQECSEYEYNFAIKFKEITDKLSINYLSATITHTESCEYLADRIVRIIDVTCGFTTGIPLIVPSHSVLRDIDEFVEKNFVNI